MVSLTPSTLLLFLLSSTTATASLFPRHSDDSHSHSPTSNAPKPTLLSKSPCSSTGGACITTTSCASQNGTRIAGLCPQFGPDMLCCFFTLPSNATATTKDNDKCYQYTKNLVEGESGDAAEVDSRAVGCVNEEYCTETVHGTTQKGLCKGPKEVKCCVAPKSWSTTSFVLPNPTTFPGHNATKGGPGHSHGSNVTVTVAKTTTTGAGSSILVSTTNVVETAATGSTTGSTASSTGGVGAVRYDGRNGVYLVEALLAGVFGLFI